jgi:hypothetical protein
LFVLSVVVPRLMSTKQSEHTQMAATGSVQSAERCLMIDRQHEESTA